MKLKLLALAAGLAAAGSVYAQAPGGPPSADVQAALAAVKQACAADAANLCAGKSDMDTTMCLMTNASKTSPDCKAAMSKLPPPPAGGPPG
jgi:hypothetical protein